MRLRTNECGRRSVRGQIIHSFQSSKSREQGVRKARPDSLLNKQRKLPVPEALFPLQRGFLKKLPYVSHRAVSRNDGVNAVLKRNLESLVRGRPSGNTPSGGGWCQRTWIGAGSTSISRRRKTGPSSFRSGSTGGKSRPFSGSSGGRGFSESSRRCRGRRGWLTCPG